MNEHHYDIVDSNHPIHTVLHGDVKGGITACIQANAYISAAKLIYAGIDLMAYLCMPEKRRVEKCDYLAWVQKYMTFDEMLNITADEVYEARHAAVHRHSLENRPGSRHLVMFHGPMEMAFPIPREIAGVDCVVISVEKFAEIFFEAIDRCLIDIHQDKQKLQRMEKRFENVAQLQRMSYDEIEKLLLALMAHYRPK